MHVRWSTSTVVSHAAAIGLHWNKYTRENARPQPILTQSMTQVTLLNHFPTNILWYSINIESLGKQRAGGRVAVSAYRICEPVSTRFGLSKQQDSESSVGRTFAKIGTSTVDGGFPRASGGVPRPASADAMINQLPILIAKVTYNNSLQIKQTAEPMANTCEVWGQYYLYWVHFSQGLAKSNNRPTIVSISSDV